MLDALCRSRTKSVEALVMATAQMVADIDPEGKRDHRSWWELSCHERARKPDIFDRIRFASDALVVIGSQLGEWRGGTHGPEHTYDAAVATFGLLLRREAKPLGQLERDVAAARLQRRQYPDLPIAALQGAVRAIRAQHDRALGVLELLEEIAA